MATGLKDAGTGDTLASPKAPIILERIDIYEPVIARAIEPKTQAEREKLDFGLKKQEGQGREPLVTYISLRMPNRGGAEGGTPELYFTDPDGLAIQLQDVKYCGGGGFLGEVCTL